MHTISKSIDSSECFICHCVGLSVPILMAACSNLYVCALRSCFRSFVDNVSPECIIDGLYERCLLDSGEIEVVRLPTTQRHKTRALGKALMRSVRTQKNFDAFLEILSEKYDFLVDKLRQYVNSDRGVHNDGSLTAIAGSDHGYNNNDCALRRCFQSFVDTVNPDSIVDSLFELYLLDDREMEEVMLSTLTITQKNQALCRALIKSSHTREKFDKFMEILSEKYNSLANELRVIFLGDASQTPMTANDNGKEIGVNLPVQEVGDSRVDLMHQSPSSRNDSNDHLTLIVSHSSRSRYFMSLPSLLPPSNHGKQFYSVNHRNLYNQLAALVNSCNERYFLCRLRSLEYRSPRDPDAECIILYLMASCSIMLSDFDKGSKRIEECLEVAKKTKTPTRFTVQLISLRVWILLKDYKRQEEINFDLAQAMQLVQQDPISCGGMAAGWILVDEAKSLMMLVTSSIYDRVRVRGLLSRAVAAYYCAIEHFGKEDSHDGPYGYHYAAVKLVSVLMACDDMLMLVERDELYCEENLHTAQQLVDDVHRSEPGLAITLESLFWIAQADVMFRKKCYRRALKFAEMAKQYAIKFKLDEDRCFADVRCKFYCSMVDEADDNAVFD